MNIVTLGTFDLPHMGHYRLLKRCADLGHTIVGLNTDAFITKYKGRPPVMTYEERKSSLEEWGYVVLPNGQEDGTIKPFLESLKGVTHIVIGSDWIERDYLSQVGLTRKYLFDNDISILFVPYTEGISTTELKRRIKDA